MRVDFLSVKRHSKNYHLKNDPNTSTTQQYYVSQARFQITYINKDPCQGIVYDCEENGIFLYDVSSFQIIRETNWKFLRYGWKYKVKLRNLSSV